MTELPFLLFSTLVAGVFFAGSLLLMTWGNRVGARHRARNGDSALAGLGSVEAAVFALMGLILAFTISGALQRFDERRELILKEANAVSTAYDRLDLLDGEAKRDIKTRLKDYLRARIELYREGIDFSFWKGAEVASAPRLQRIDTLKTGIWSDAVTACGTAKDRMVCALILPSLNTAFEAARSRNGANERHPPQAIYLMLFAFELGSSFLAGVTMSAGSRKSWVHMVSFAAALALALFVITDIEFPRLGLVRVNAFDHHLSDLHEQMQTR